MATREEIPLTEEDVIQILRVVGEDAVLVGGQAVGVWAGSFGITPDTNTESLTFDMDFLAKNPELVKRVAKATGGIAQFPIKRAMTALVGQVIIPEGENLYKNVDFISEVFEVGDEKVIKQARSAKLGDIKFKVIHPFHLLLSKAENYQHLESKRNLAGRKQLEIAILIAKAYLERQAEKIEGDDDSALRNDINEYVMIARSGAGSHARKQGIDFLSAIPIDKVKHENFLSKQWPAIQKQLVHNEQAISSPPSDLKP